MSLINAHTHLEFSNRGYLLPFTSADFVKWIAKIAKDNDSVPPEEYLKACEQGVKELVQSGTTHVGDISKTGNSLPFLIEYGLSGIIWIQVLGERIEKGLQKLEKAKTIIDFCRNQAKNSSIEMGMSLHAPYSVNPALWEPALRYCKSESLSVCIHVAESPSEFELFTKGTGNHRELEKELGLPELPCPHMTPIAYLNKVGVLEFSPYLVHVVQVNDNDIELIQKSKSKVVHCPRSNQKLECGRMPLEKFLDKNIDVYLGTDSRASSPSLNILEEMEYAKQVHKGLVGEEIIESLIKKPLH